MIGENETLLVVLFKIPILSEESGHSFSFQGFPLLDNHACDDRWVETIDGGDITNVGQLGVVAVFFLRGKVRRR